MSPRGAGQLEGGECLINTATAYTAGLKTRVTLSSLIQCNDIEVKNWSS